MGVDYESGPHQTKRKRTDADSTTPSKVTKTSTYATPSTSHKASSATTTKVETTKAVEGHDVNETRHHTTKQDKATPTQHQAEQEDTLTSSSSSLSDSESLPEVPFNM